MQLVAKSSLALVLMLFASVGAAFAQDKWVLWEDGLQRRMLTALPPPGVNSISR